MERQQALAEAVVRQMDTHEIVAIASGRFGGPGGLLSRGRGRLSHRSQAEQTAGVSQVSKVVVSAVVLHVSGTQCSTSFNRGVFCCCWLSPGRHRGRKRRRH